MIGTRTIEVVFEKGMLKPLEPVELEEGEKARIEIKRNNKILDKREKTREILNKLNMFKARKTGGDLCGISSLLIHCFF